jgi:hypothetical protein
MARAGLYWDERAHTAVFQKLARLSLCCLAGPQAGLVFGSDGDPITIGRGGGCAIRVFEPVMSRRHARITYRAGQFWIEDLKTLNGTFLNGTPVNAPTPLGEGDFIALGELELEVRLGDVPDREVVRDSAAPYVSEPTSVPLDVSIEVPRTNFLATGVAWLARRRHALRTAGLFALCGIVGMVATWIIVRVGMGARAERPGRVTVVAAPGKTPAPQTPHAPPPRAARPSLASIETPGAVAVLASGDGIVGKSVAAGARVSPRQLLVELRPDGESDTGLEQLNAALEDDEDNTRLAERARQRSLELLEARVIVRSPLRGVVVGEPPRVGTRVRAGQLLLRVAPEVRMRVDAAAVEGAGSACEVQFCDSGAVAAARALPADGDARRFVLVEPAPLAPGKVLVRCAAPRPSGG